MNLAQTPVVFNFESQAILQLSTYNFYCLGSRRGERSRGLLIMPVRRQRGDSWPMLRRASKSIARPRPSWPNMVTRRHLCESLVHWWMDSSDMSTCGAESGAVDLLRGNAHFTLCSRSKIDVKAKMMEGGCTAIMEWLACRQYSLETSRVERGFFYSFSCSWHVLNEEWKRLSITIDLS